jgi:hypothetical protein
MNFFNISYLGGPLLSHTHVMPILGGGLCVAKSIRCINGTTISCRNPILKECGHDIHTSEMGTWESSETLENSELN